jgi:hypothetical protein
MRYLVGRNPCSWHRKRVRFIVYLIAALGGIYAALLAAPNPPRDDEPLPTLGGVTDVSRIDPLYSRIASRIAGHDVEVRCWSEKDWLELSEEIDDWTDGELLLGPWSGIASEDGERASLAPTICDSLGRWAYERRWPEDRREAYYFAWSVKALAHEAQHLRGIENEAKAECYGLQTMREVGNGLGLGDEHAQSLADYAWLYIYPRARGDYWSDDCRDGGELDLRADSSVWP